MFAAESAQASILFVCTGNVCRSPYMEYALRAMLTTSGVAGVPIASAGTRALEGHPMAEFMALRLRERGVDATGFRAARLSDEALQSAGIVVTATREQRRDIVRYGTELAERTFTLAQLARLLHADASASAVDGTAVPASASERIARLVSAASAARHAGTSAASADDDLDDPWQRSRRRYRRVAERIDQLLIPVAARLAAGD